MQWNILRLTMLFSRTHHTHVRLAPPFFDHCLPNVILFFLFRTKRYQPLIFNYMIHRPKKHTAIAAHIYTFMRLKHWNPFYWFAQTKRNKKLNLQTSRLGYIFFFFGCLSKHVNHILNVPIASLVKMSIWRNFQQFVIFFLNVNTCVNSCFFFGSSVHEMYFKLSEAQVASCNVLRLLSTILQHQRIIHRVFVKCRFLSN